MPFETKTADQLVDPELRARLAERRQAREGAVLRFILRAFADSGGPVAVQEVERAFAGWPPGRVAADLEALDRDDLIVLQDGAVRLAYPFSADPTPFLVRLEDGRERYACCAIDALGVAAMLEAPALIRSRCHHCGEPLEFEAGAAGPRGGDGVVVWVGAREPGARRVATSL